MIFNREKKILFKETRTKERKKYPFFPVSVLEVSCSPVLFIYTSSFQQVVERGTLIYQKETEQESEAGTISYSCLCVSA